MIKLNESTKQFAGRIITPHGRIWRTIRFVYFFYPNLRQYIKLRYRTIAKNSIFFDVQEMKMCSLQHPGKMQKTLDLYRPCTLLDLGCGTGISLDFFLEKGIDAVGIEGSRLAQSQAKNPDHIKLMNLNHEINLQRKFDLVWCMEVVEHIHPDYVNNLMKTFANHSNRIVLSAAQPGQGGEGHFNEQPASYWIDLFRQWSYVLDVSGTSALQAIEEEFSENMLAFVRAKVDNNVS